MFRTKDITSPRSLTDYSVSKLVLSTYEFSLYEGDECFIKWFKIDKNHLFDYEIECYSNLNHPNIVSNYIAIKDAQAIGIENNEVGSIIIFFYKQDLFSLIFRESSVSEELGKKYFKHLLSALKHIHSEGIIHKNLKIENIFIEDDRLLISSFSNNGVSIAPESITFSLFNEQTDIFSLGIILFELVNGTIPFQSATPDDWWYKKIINKDHKLFWMAHDPKLFRSNEFKDLIQKIFEIDPNTRISLKDIEAHPWLSQ